MKLIIAILLLALTTFANTTYIDGTECGCDSIHRAYYSEGGVKYEAPYLHGKEVLGVSKHYNVDGTKWGDFNAYRVDVQTPRNEIQIIDTAFWYNKTTSSYCTIYATTPNNEVYNTFDYCDYATTSGDTLFRHTLAIKACKNSFKSNDKSKLYDYLTKCVEFTTIEHKEPLVSFYMCGTSVIVNGKCPNKPSNCDYDAICSESRK